MTRRRYRRALTAALCTTVMMLAVACAATPEPAVSETPTPTAISPWAEVSTVAVLGDSMSLGVNACAQRGACPEASWATGSDVDVDSVAARVGAETGTFPAVVNGADDGGRVGDALNAVDVVVAAGPELVLVLIGANDACASSVDAMTSVDEFRATFAALVGGLADGLPEARILALSIPDVLKLWELGHTNPTALERWSGSESCRNLLGDASATDAAAVERRAAVAARVDEFNAAIEAVCTETDSCTPDGGAAHSYEFSVEEISQIDFFHPSVAGQRALAEVAWTVLEEAS